MSGLNDSWINHIEVSREYHWDFSASAVTAKTSILEFISLFLDLDECETKPTALTVKFVEYAIVIKVSLC
jgi:hypothetical protein